MKMKMTTERYTFLRDAVLELAKDRPLAAASYSVDGLTAERFRWDVLWCLRKQNDGLRSFVSDCYDDGMNDTHIDTALRRAVGEAWGGDYARLLENQRSAR